VRGGYGVLITAVLLYLATAAQQSLSRWTLLGGGPDYTVLALSALCLFTSRKGGAVIGFFDGWLLASLNGSNMWQYVLTRTIGGYLISWTAESGIERSLFSALLAGFLGVLFCRLSFMFLAPPPALASFLGDTIRTAVYNGVLAMLLYAALNRIVGPRR
jgi:rod shape-determining protein MreD